MLISWIILASPSATTARSQYTGSMCFRLDKFHRTAAERTWAISQHFESLDQPRHELAPEDRGLQHLQIRTCSPNHFICCDPMGSDCEPDTSVVTTPARSTRSVLSDVAWTTPTSLMRPLPQSPDFHKFYTDFPLSTPSFCPDPTQPLRNCVFAFASTTMDPWHRRPRSRNPCLYQTPAYLFC